MELKTDIGNLYIKYNSTKSNNECTFYRLFMIFQILIQVCYLFKINIAINSKLSCKLQEFDWLRNILWKGINYFPLNNNAMLSQVIDHSNTQVPTVYTWQQMISPKNIHCPISMLIEFTLDLVWCHLFHYAFGTEFGNANVFN